MFLTLEAHSSTLLTTGPWKLYWYGRFLNLCRFYFPPSGVYISEQDLQHTNHLSLLLFFFFAWSKWCYQGNYVLREVQLSFSDHIMTSKVVNKMLEQNCNIIVHSLDFLYLQLPCLSTSIILLRTREMTPLRSMDPMDPL